MTFELSSMTETALLNEFLLTVWRMHLFSFNQYQLWPPRQTLPQKYARARRTQLMN